MNTVVSHKIRTFGRPTTLLLRDTSPRIVRTLPALNANPGNLRTGRALATSTSHQPNLADQRDHAAPSQVLYTDDDIKILAEFRSEHNYIRVLELSRAADHPFAGSRLLLLDTPGNIHSVSFLLDDLTRTYLDVFATFPPLLPPGPIGILGFGAGSAARLILHFHPGAEVHGWELDPAVVSVGREYFGLAELEGKNPGNLRVRVGDALEAVVDGGFAGLIVDLFAKGSVVPELQEARTWEELRARLRPGGRIMVNCAGSCVEAEDARDGDIVRDETLRAIGTAYGEEGLLMLDYGRGKEDDSCLALTGGMPDREKWKEALPPELREYVDLWTPYCSSASAGMGS